MTEYTMESAVQAGVKYLDGLYPGWDELIRWDELNIEALDRCIVGQLSRYVDFGVDFSYYDHIDEGFETAEREDGTRCGEDYDHLTQAWKAWNRNGRIRSE